LTQEKGGEVQGGHATRREREYWRTPGKGDWAREKGENISPLGERDLSHMAVRRGLAKRKKKGNLTMIAREFHGDGNLTAQETILRRATFHNKEGEVGG